MQEYNPIQESKPMYTLSRVKSPTSDIVVFWTGNPEKPWSESTDDAVVFRSKAAAEHVAQSKRWTVRQPTEWSGNPMAVTAHLVELKVKVLQFELD